MSSSGSNEIRRESPLLGRVDTSARTHRDGAAIYERAFLGHINLRGDPRSAAFTEHAARVLGAVLPIVPNTVHAGDEHTLFWLGPNEWLIVCPGEQEQRLAIELRACSPEHLVSVVELSGGQTVLRLSNGVRARELLSKGCPLDLHPRAFTVGQCAQTHLAKAPVLLRAIPDGMEVVVRRSFADYLWHWLDTAAG